MPRVYNNTYPQYQDPASVAGEAIAGAQAYRANQLAIKEKQLDIQGKAQAILLQKKAQDDAEANQKALQQAGSWFIDHYGVDRLKKTPGTRALAGAIYGPPQAPDKFVSPSLEKAGVSLSQGPNGMSQWGHQYTPEQKKKIADAKYIISKLTDPKDIRMFMGMVQAEMDQEIAAGQMDMVMRDLSSLMQELTAETAEATGGGGGEGAQPAGMVQSPDVDPIRMKVESLIDELGAQQKTPQQVWEEARNLRIELAEIKVDTNMRAMAVSDAEQKMAVLAQENMLGNADKIAALWANSEMVRTNAIPWKEGMKKNIEIISGKGDTPEEEFMAGNNNVSYQNMPKRALAWGRKQAENNVYERIKGTWIAEALKNYDPTAEGGYGRDRYLKATEALAKMQAEEFVSLAEQAGWDTTESPAFGEDDGNTWNAKLKGLKHHPQALLGWQDRLAKALIEADWSPAARERTKNRIYDEFKVWIDDIKESDPTWLEEHVLGPIEQRAKQEATKPPPEGSIPRSVNKYGGGWMG